MIRLVLASLLLLSTFGTWAARHVVPEAGLSFDAPAGFTPLSKDEIALKYPSSRAPGSVIGNARRTTTIAYELTSDRVTLAQLAEVKRVFEQQFERIVPGLEWKSRRMVKLVGQDWIWLEMTSRAVDTDIHNIMLVTSRGGRMLIFNFNSTQEEFPAVEGLLRRSIQSIALDGPPRQP